MLPPTVAYQNTEYYFILPPCRASHFTNQKFVKDSLYSFLEYPGKYILLSSNLSAMNNMCIKRCHSSLSTLINIIIMTFNILLGWKLKASLANEGVLQKGFVRGGSTPWPNPLSFKLIYHFCTPFVPSIDKLMVPLSHIYAVV